MPTRLAWYYRLAIACLAVAISFQLFGSGAQGAAPNVVLIVADDLGLQLGCYGDSVVKTPHIDALSKRGTRFTRAFCTTASCSPSRSVILTGLQNHANGQLGLEHDVHHFAAYAKMKGLPSLLEARGYRTANVGKLHVSPPSVFKFGETIKADSRNPTTMANACEEFLKAPSEQPFFLYFCPVDPHRSGPPADKQFSRIAAQPRGKEGFPSDLLKRPTSASELFIDKFGNSSPPAEGAKVYSPQEVPVPYFLPDTQTCREELAQYYQSISRVDDGVGRLVDLLRATGKLENTLILFTSDNGPPWPNAKTTHYNSGLHLPLIACYPGQTEGRTCDAMVTHADLAPTILDFTGGSEPLPAMHGRSWKAAAMQTSPEGWNECYHSHTFHEVTMYYPMRTIQTPKFKLIWNIASGTPFPFASDLYESATWQETLLRDRARQGGGEARYGNRTVSQYIHRPEWELFDLEFDPTESRNLANAPEHVDTLKALQQKLRDFQARTKDPWVVKWEHP